MSALFTTALILPVEHFRNSSWYLDRFNFLAKSGLNLVAYVSPHLIEEAKARYPDIRFEPVILEDLESYRIAMSSNETQLPGARSSDKDTKLYMAIINAKTELVLRTMNNNSGHSHYGWIDFGIAHISRDPVGDLTKLKSQCERLISPLLAIPGIWHNANLESLTLHVVWRFCGGLFIGDEQSVREFHRLSIQALRDAIEKTGIVVWEVNIWARMELEYGWKPDWYPADHNETMLVIPERFLN